MRSHGLQQAKYPCEVDGEEVRKEVGGIAEKARGMAKEAELKVKGK